MGKKIGIDVGGTNIAAGLVSNGRLVRYAEVPTPKTKKAFLKSLFYAIDSVFHQDVVKIGIGFPAPVVKGVVSEVQNIKSLNGTNLKEEVEKKFKVECFVENDANVFVLAEAKGRKNVVGITLGTGLGCGILINGMIYSGNTGAAGEISRTPAGGSQLENHVNARFFKRKYGKSPKVLYEMAKKGNKMAKNAWEKYGQNLGIVLSFVVEAYDPEMIVLGGKIANAFPYFSKYLKPEMKKHCFKNSILKLKIVKSKLKNSGVIGAAML